MNFRLLAFGVAREMVGSENVLDLPAVKDVGSLRLWLEERYPQMSGLSKWAISVNEKYAGDSTPISPGDVVAIIPPVSGG
jgi:molybdopterin converting factor small subunit